MRSMKNVAVLTKDGAFALFFRPHPGGIWQLKSPHPQELICHPRQKKNANAQGSPKEGGGGAGYSWNNLKLTLTCNKYISPPPRSTPKLTGTPLPL